MTVGQLVRTETTDAEGRFIGATYSDPSINKAVAIVDDGDDEFELDEEEETATQIEAKRVAALTEAEIIYENRSKQMGQYQIGRGRKAYHWVRNFVGADDRSYAEYQHNSNKAKRFYDMASAVFLDGLAMRTGWCTNCNTRILDMPLGITVKCRHCGADNRRY